MDQGSSHVKTTIPTARDISGHPGSLDGLGRLLENHPELAFRVVKQCDPLTLTRLRRTTRSCRRAATKAAIEVLQKCTLQLQPLACGYRYRTEADERPISFDIQHDEDLYQGTCDYELGGLGPWVVFGSRPTPITMQCVSRDGHVLCFRPILPNPAQVPTSTSGGIFHWTHEYFDTYEPANLPYQSPFFENTHRFAELCEGEAVTIHWPVPECWQPQSYRGLVYIDEHNIKRTGSKALSRVKLVEHMHLKYNGESLGDEHLYAESYPTERSKHVEVTYGRIIKHTMLPDAPIPRDFDDENEEENYPIMVPQVREEGSCRIEQLRVSTTYLMNAYLHHSRLLPDVQAKMDRYYDGASTDASGAALELEIDVVIKDLP